MIYKVPLFSLASVTVTHYAFWALLALAAGVTAWLALGKAAENRIRSSAGVAVIAGILGPLMVSPVYSSDGPWTWGIGLFATTAGVSVALIHALRAAFGCVLTTRTEWVLWVTAIVLGSSASAIAGSGARFLPTIITFAGALLLTHFLPAHLASTPLFSERVRAAGAVALPVLLTGVAWAGMPALLIPCVIALLCYRINVPEQRVPYTRMSVFLVHLVSALAPFFLLSFGVPHLN